MSLPRYPQITEELLSAYLDDAVSEEERELVERAVRNDADVAKQLESLRQTVQLLRTLPAVALPRSFTLDAVMLEVAAEKVAGSPSRVAAKAAERVAPKRHGTQPTWWQRFAATFSGFTPLRNAMAVVLLLLVAFYVGNWSFLLNSTFNSAPTEGELAGLQVASVQNAEITRGAAALAAEATTADLPEQSNDNQTPAIPNDRQATVAADAVETVEAVETVNSAPVATEAVAVAGAAGILTEDDPLAFQGEASDFAEAPTAPLAQQVPSDSAAGFPPSGPAQNRSTGGGSMRPGDDTQVLNPGQPSGEAMALRSPTAFVTDNGINETPVVAEQTDTSVATPADEAIVMAAAATDTPDAVAQMEGQVEGNDMMAKAAAPAAEADVVETVAAETVEDALAVTTGDGADSVDSEEDSEEMVVVAANVGAGQSFSSTLATPVATAALEATTVEPLSTVPTVTPTSTITPTLTPTVTDVVTSPVMVSPVSTSPVATPTPTPTPLAHLSETQVATMAVPWGVIPLFLFPVVPLLWAHKRKHNA
ncbi:MAG: zf-HC2 domain-containing protein [Caldilineaceae bacterium]|nr:zf-HC2 domain-containing protein [Caldilineaceae bacterium]